MLSFTRSYWGQMDFDLYGKMGIGKMNNGYCKEHGEKVIKY
jgi:hypothetical protein